MTQRDRYILGALPVLALIAAFWFLALGPKRAELRKLNKDVATSQRDIEAARGQTQQFAADRLEFPRAYATLVRLGKAVPADPDVASLVVQLEAAASRAGVDFRKINLLTAGSGSSSGSGAENNPPPPAPTATPSGGSAGATGSYGSQTPTPGSAQSGAASGTTGGAAPAGGTGAASSATATATGAAAPANALSAATLPLGSEIGAAQLPILRFNMIFQGNFFKMANFVHNVRALVMKQGRRLTVSGRLLTVDAIAFKDGDKGFPQVKAGIAATAYLVPAAQGLLAGATPQGPAGGTAATPTPASGGNPSVTPPAAVVTTP